MTIKKINTILDWATTFKKNKGKGRIVLTTYANGKPKTVKV